VAKTICFDGYEETSQLIYFCAFNITFATYNVTYVSGNRSLSLETIKLAVSSMARPVTSISVNPCSRAKDRATNESQHSSNLTCEKGVVDESYFSTSKVQRNVPFCKSRST